MGQFQNSVMVALLPTTSDWCHIEVPHLTLVYVGEMPTVQPTVQNELAKAAILMSQDFGPITLDVLGLDLFGKDSLQEVLLLRSTPELLAMRRVVEVWDCTAYTEFKPHVTVGPVGSSADELPNQITFDWVMVSWGETEMPYRLSKETS